MCSRNCVTWGPTYEDLSHESEPPPPPSETADDLSEHCEAYGQALPGSWEYDDPETLAMRESMRVLVYLRVRWLRAMHDRLSWSRRL